MMDAPSDSTWPVLDRLVDRLIDARRAIAAAQAAEVTLLAEAVDVIADRTVELRQRAQGEGRRFVSTADLPAREVSLELGAAMRVSDRTVQSRLSDAFELTTYFPATFDAWTTGEIDAGHAWAISRAGMLLDDETDRARYEPLALAAARTESPARLAEATKAIAATTRPDLFADRARIASEERRMRLYDHVDGMSRLILDAPTPILHAIYDRADQMAIASLATPCAETVTGDTPDAAATALEQQQTADAPTTGPMTRALTGPTTRTTGAAGKFNPATIDSRSMDQTRADIACDLLLTGIPTGHDAALGSIRGRIQVIVPATTLAGVTADSGPALLAGAGPIDPDLARRLAGLAPGWDRATARPRRHRVDRSDRTTICRPSAGVRPLRARSRRGPPPF